jgi:hypothetical protein
MERSRRPERSPPEDGPAQEPGRAPRIPKTMRALPPSAVARYRRAVLRRHRVRTRGDALKFINALGLCYAFTPGPGHVPGLFDALATRSIDRMWGWAWRWKDELATRRQVHYGKVLRRKPSYLSLTLLPAFYALSGNLGEPDDHLQAYREGRLSALAKAVYEQILADGPVSTWTLRRCFVPRGDSGARFHRALDDLQERFLVAKVAEADEWRKGFIWDAFHRWMPDVVQAANALTREAAATAVLERYLAILGAAGPAEVVETFGWNRGLTAAAAQRVGLPEATLDGRRVWAARALATTSVR